MIVTVFLLNDSLEEFTWFGEESGDKAFGYACLQGTE